MSYIDQPGMVGRFSEVDLLTVADRDDDGELDTELIDLAAADASSTIDSYLAVRYVVPVTADPLPEMLVRLAGDITRYLLYKNNPLSEVTTRYEAAMRELRDLASGRANLIGATPALSGSGTFQYAASKGASDRQFTASTLSDF
jgi:phage gp36-like protein